MMEIFHKFHFVILCYGTLSEERISKFTLYIDFTHYVGVAPQQESLEVANQRYPGTMWTVVE